MNKPMVIPMAIWIMLAATLKTFVGVFSLTSAFHSGREYRVEEGFARCEDKGVGEGG